MIHLAIVEQDELDAPVQTPTGLWPLVREVRRQCVSDDLLFAGSGLSARQLDNPAARMSRRQRLIILENAKRMAPMPDTAIRAGQDHRSGDFGIFGLAFAAQPTLREALRFHAQMVSLASPLLQIHYVETAEGMISTTLDYEQLGDMLPFAMEYWRSGQARLVRLALGRRSRSTRLLFPYKAPVYWREYEQIFGCSIEFDAAALEWHVDNAMLDQRFPNANASTASMLGALCIESMRERSRHTSNIAVRIRKQLLETGLTASAPETASRLGLSLRSLFRRLAEEGSSYQSIVDEVRCDLAIGLLRSSGTKIEEVAQRLGFTEPSNFTKAFRRWTGLTPSQYRDGRLPRQVFG